MRQRILENAVRIKLIGQVNEIADIGKCSEVFKGRHCIFQYPLLDCHISVVFLVEKFSKECSRNRFYKISGKQERISQYS